MKNNENKIYKCTKILQQFSYYVVYLIKLYVYFEKIYN